MSSIFPYVGFNHSSSAPCLGGLPILRSPEELPGQGITKEVSRLETNSEQNGLALGSGNNQEQIAAPLDKNSAEVAQAKNEHNAGIRRLISRIRNNLGRASVAVALGLALSLSSCAFDALSKRGSNTELSQTQGVVEPYFGNGESGAYVPFWATDVPREVNGKGFLYPDLATTPPPTELGN